ncbi:ABC transporter ATP-binding protein [Marinomonas spartinae]|nr:ABC transporter ATP-binding protein [Marinomonas spartinae]
MVKLFVILSRPPDYFYHLFFLVILFSSFISVLAPYVFSKMIDDMTGNQWQEKMTVLVIFYAVLIGLSLTLNNTVNYLSAMLAENLNFSAATNFFERLVKKSPHFFIEHNPAEIHAVQRQGAQAVNILVQLMFMVILPGLAQLIFTLLVLGLTIDIRVVLIVLAYGIIYISLTYFSNKITRKYLQAATQKGQSNAQLVGNAVTLMETLRYFDATDWMSRRFRHSAKEILHNWRRYSLKKILFSGGYGVALCLQFTITLTIFLPKYHDGELSVGNIVLFNMLLLQLNRPFEMAGLAIEGVMRALTEFRPFAQMWSAPEEVALSSQTSYLDKKIVKGVLTFNNVSFFYKNGRGVSGISFTAKRGGITFITGETGKGKSTLLKLALKYAEPSSGAIYIDDQVLHQINRTDWYHCIGVVPQEIILLNDTLEANITLGRPIDQQQLESVAAKAAILKKIESLPDGFATQVGERGLTLSGGERQRIAIARALYSKPQFLFLDEASSSLDEATQNEIMQYIRNIAKDVTVIAITHQTSLIHHTDNVVHLN